MKKGTKIEQEVRKALLDLYNGDAERAALHQQILQDKADQQRDDRSLLERLLDWWAGLGEPAEEPAPGGTDHEEPQHED